MNTNPYEQTTQSGQAQPTPPPYVQPPYVQPPYVQPPYVQPPYVQPQEALAQQVLQAQRVAQEKKLLRQHGNRAGAALLVFHALGILLGVVLTLFQIEDALDDYVFFCAVNGLCSILGIFLPYLWMLSRSGRNRRAIHRSLGRPYHTGHMLLTVPIGFAVCLLANYITGIFVSLMEDLGIILQSPDLAGGSTFAELFAGLLAVAVIPALTEEFAMRGVVMQPLRRYGDRFAIVASAVLFGAMHGNLVQAPFAFFVGLVVGYFTVLTGSIWTGVLIHFVNNLFSVLVSAGMDYFTDENESFLNGVLAFEGLVLLVAILCTVLLCLKVGKRQLCPPSVTMGTAQKYFAFFTAPCMLIALLLLAVSTAAMVDFG